MKIITFTIELDEFNGGLPEMALLADKVETLIDKEGQKLLPPNEPNCDPPILTVVKTEVSVVLT